MEIETRQNGEDIGLQQGDADFQTGQRDQEQQRRPAQKQAKRNDETAEHFQHGVAGHHIGEQSHRQADRPDEVRYDLDRYQQHH